MKIGARIIAVATTLVAWIGTGPVAHAQSDDAFYKNRKIVLLIAATAGGGYDRWGRLVSSHMGKYLPGKPSIINQNMGAAGGIVGTGHIYNKLERDGSAFGLITRDAPLAPIMHPKRIPYNPVRLNWIGSPTTETSVCIARPGAKVQSLEDLKKQELIVGDTGGGTGTYVFPRALAGMFGLKFRAVSGYQNSVDVMLAIDRKEVDGICESLASVDRKHPGWLKKGSFKAIIHGGAEPDPDLKGVPFVMELAKTAADKAALRFLYAGQGIGRPFVAPPDVPPARLKILREAFDKTMRDAEFLADAKKLKFEVHPVGGEKLGDLIKELNQTPRDVVERVAAFMKK